METTDVSVQKTLTKYLSLGLTARREDDCSTSATALMWQAGGNTAVDVLRIVWFLL